MQVLSLPILGCWITLELCADTAPEGLFVHLDLLGQADSRLGICVRGREAKGFEGIRE